MAGNDQSSQPGRVFFEFTQLGPQMRVAAIDEASGTEVVVIAPLTATPQQMQQLALAKLRRKLGGGQPPPAARRRRATRERSPGRPAPRGSAADRGCVPSRHADREVPGEGEGVGKIGWRRRRIADKEGRQAQQPIEVRLGGGTADGAAGFWRDMGEVRG